MRDYNKAIKYLVQAIDTKPDYIEAIALLASVYRHSKQTQKAIITYKNVLATNSRDVNAIAGLGWSYIESTEPDLGIEYYNKLLSVSPNDGDALFFLFEIIRGDLHKKLGKRFSYSSQFLEKSLLLLDVQKIVAFGDSHVMLFDQCDAVDVHHVGASTAFNLLENDSSTGGRKEF